jgi:hypothetical protein
VVTEAKVEMLRDQLDEIGANPEEVTTAVAAELCCLVLALTSRHDLERVVGQPPLQVTPTLPTFGRSRRSPILR